MTAVFLDRDGVINANRNDHVKCWEEFQFLPGSVEAIARLSQARMRNFVFTNQAIVNRGTVTHAVVDGVNRKMTQQIESRGGKIDAVAYCPHRPEEQCGCRKPEPGLLFSLAQRHAVDLRTSFVIGDALTDIQAGQAAGCKTILVLTGRGQQQHALAVASGEGGYAVASDLSEAADLVLSEAARHATQALMPPKNHSTGPLLPTVAQSPSTARLARASSPDPDQRVWRSTPIVARLSGPSWALRS